MGRAGDGVVHGPGGALAEMVAAAVATVVSDANGTDCLDVAARDWYPALAAAAAGAARLDWLGGVDLGPTPGRRDTDPEEPLAPTIEVVAYLLTDRCDVLLRTRVEPGSELDSAVPLFPSADWHERETAEMLGVAFTGGPRSALLLSNEVAGHPLRRDFALIARTTTAWPGAADDANRRRRPRVPGVNPEWVDERPVEGAP